MDFDSFLGEKRWQILQLLAGKSYSPLELAEILSTTVSYISQQLKLLEALGIIYKTKTGLAKKGKPRSLYSLSREFAYVTILTKEVAEKKMIELTSYHKAALIFWSLPNNKIHESCHRFLMKLQEFSKDIENVYFDYSNVSFLIVGNSSLKSKLESFMKLLDIKVKYTISNKIKSPEKYILMLEGNLKKK